MRAIRTLLAWAAVTIVLVAGILPGAVFILEIISEHGLAAWTEAVRKAWSARVFGLWRETFFIALFGSAAATGWGFLCSSAIRSRPNSERNFWTLLQVLTLLQSPYVIVQGWLNLAALLPSSAALNLYSPASLLVFESLIHAPLGFLIFRFASHAEDIKLQEFHRIFHIPLPRRIASVFRRRYLWPCSVSLILIFLSIYWQYDAPSMLRQNLLSLEVTAAFGSFFDHLQAAAVAVPAAVVALPAAAVLTLLLSTNRINLRKPDEVISQTRFSSIPVLIIVPLLTTGAATIGLLLRLTNPTEALKALSMAGADAGTTLWVGLASAVLLTLAGIATALFVRLKLPASRYLLAIPCVSLAVPAVVTGIGLVLLRSQPVWDQILSGSPTLVVVNLLVQSPFIILLSICLMSGWSEQQSDFVKTFRPPSRTVVFKLAMPMIVTSAPVLFLAAFALSIREVPASLLNYPPDGATLALTIETMIHFEQPAAVSALCLLQLLLVVFVSGLSLYFWRLMRRWFGWRSYEE